MHTMKATLFALLLVAVGCDGGDPIDGDADLNGDADTGGDTGGDGGGDSDQFPNDSFAVTGVIPSHGIFSGLSPVVIRGRGFAEGAEVYFGDQQIAPEVVVVQDENRIACLTPPGDPDSYVDVTVVQGDEEAVLEDGFYYDPCQLSPNMGTVSGGTYVVISCLGTDLETGVNVTFDDVDAADIERVGPAEIHLRTPPGRVGPADVVIESVTGDIVLAEAFTYFENTNPLSGGLGGNPIDGNIEINVLSGADGSPLEDSYVILGVDDGTEFQGWTDASGHIVFSGPNIAGRQLIITASHGPVPLPIDMDCDDIPDIELEMGYETASFTEFDATYVTVLLNPIMPMVMVPPCDESTPLPSYIEGELMFESQGEFGPYDWEIVPEPIPPHEMKLSYVQTTAPDIFLDPLAGELETTGTISGGPGSIVGEDNIGVNGFTYRIQSRYGAVAVYALAGIYNTNTATFTPYAFGIARGVLVPPGETVTGVNIMMVTSLDETVFVRFEDAPTAGRYYEGPNRYTAELFVDLGVEGIIWRPDRASQDDSPGHLHVFPSWMPREGALSDSTLIVSASALSIVPDGMGGEMLVYPLSFRFHRGVTNWTADVVVDRWLGFSEPVEPFFGGNVVDNHFEWENGTGDFHFTNIRINRGGPYWNLVLPSDQTIVDMPPLPEEFTPAATEAQVDVWHHRVEPGFDFDHWEYGDYGRDVQEAYSGNAWLVNY